MRNARDTPEPKELPQIGGGTFITYPTFRTSASLSHGSPLPSHLPTHSYIEAAKTSDETPHPAPSATQPEPLPRRRRPQQHLDVPHPPYRMRIRHDLIVPPVQPPRPPPPRSCPDVTLVFRATSIPTPPSSPAPPEEHHHRHFLGSSCGLIGTTKEVVH